MKWFQEMLIRQVKYPNQVWMLDMAGPMPTKSGQYEYIFTAIDLFDGRIIMEPQIGTTATETSINVANCIIYPYGTPEVITADNGSNFNNAMARHLAASFGYSVRFSIAWTPTSQGKIERSHRVLNEAIRTQRRIIDFLYANTDLLWHLLLPSICSMVNNTKNVITGKSSNEIRFGTRNRGPLEVKFKHHSLDTGKYIINNMVNYDKYIKYMNDLRDLNMKFALEHKQAADAKRKEIFDKTHGKKHTPILFRTNDPVNVSTIRPNRIVSKLDARTEPGWKIAKQINPNSFKLCREFPNRYPKNLRNKWAQRAQIIPRYNYAGKEIPPLPNTQSQLYEHKRQQGNVATL